MSELTPSWWDKMKRYWRRNKNRYPTVTTTSSNGNPVIYQTSINQNLRDPTQYNQQQIIDQKYVKALYNSYTGSYTGSFLTTPPPGFQQKIRQKYSCRGIIYDYVVPANINTSSMQRDDQGIQWFWAMNKNDTTPIQISQCRHSQSSTGGKKHKSKKSKTQKSKTQKSKTKTQKRNKKETKNK
jgi:hypothetical protein